MRLRFRAPRVDGKRFRIQGFMGFWGLGVSEAISGGTDFLWPVRTVVPTSLQCKAAGA